MAIFQSEKKKIIHLRSFSGDAFYKVDLEKRTCNCAAFRMLPGPPCKHLNAVGIYSERRTFVPPTHPTFSQALSGLVKSLRIRRVADAVYWLVYLDTFKDKAHRFRVARRLLVGSAEDGHSVGVMEQVAKHFPVLTQVKTDLLYLAAEAVRICKVPNWWHPASGGADYIRSGLLGERDLLHFPGEHNLENMSKLIQLGIERGDRSSTIAGVIGLSHARIGGSKQAEMMLALAEQYDHPLAERFARVHLSARSALSNDNNFLCQAGWMLAGGKSPVADSLQPVLMTEVVELLDQAKERWRNPKPIPRWCCDGLHSAGDDVRFMGVWQHMFAVCRAFEHYGRIDPEDEWRREFQCYDGLHIKEGD